MEFDLRGIGMTSRRTRLRLVKQLQEQGIDNPLIIDVLKDLPRHIFVDEALAHRAYENTALPIGHNQTISQPYIVARMTELLLDGRPLKKVLEVGTGSGYQAAILAGLAERVFTVERIQPLLEKARQRFRALGLDNIFSQLADGHWGWPEEGPFDGIMVTAAPEQIPEDLIMQLADGAKLAIPVGAGGRQHLLVLTRQGDEVISETVESVRFVPLLGGTQR